MTNLSISDWISIINSVVLTLTFIAIVIYTRETIQLRRSADRQVELALEQQRGAIRLILLVEFDWYTDGQADNLPLLRNIGAGALHWMFRFSRSESRKKKGLNSSEFP